MAWPHKILTQMENVQMQHVEDEERFHKIQLVDQNNFQERLESLQVRASPRSPVVIGSHVRLFVVVHKIHFGQLGYPR